MKYLFLCFALLFTNYYNSNSQNLWCGSTPPESVRISFPNLTGVNCNNKDVDVYYCCSYNPTSGITTIDIKGFGIWDLDCWVGQDFSDPNFHSEIRQKLIEQLINDPLLACHLTNVPSCDSPPFFSFVDVVTSSCFKIVKEENEQLNIVAC